MARVFSPVRVLLAGWILCVVQLANGQLSTPGPSDSAGPRADAIAALAAKIQNEPRALAVGDQVFPYFNGPVATPGSLTYEIRLREAGFILQNRNEYPNLIAGFTIQHLPTLTSLDAVAALFDQPGCPLERPMSTDNSDTTFGRERVTVKPMKLTIVRDDEYRTTTFALSDADLARICGRGVSWRNIRARKSLFVEDFSDAAQWNDPAAPEKYTPNVLGFFCYNRERQQLLPIEIHYPDTQIKYTPLDAATNEWTLAKMGLQAASVCYHQVQHMASTHAMVIPIKVEGMRHLAAQHPVRALLERHIGVDFGIELLLAVNLLSPGTPTDMLFGWGATGSTRFLGHEMEHVVSFKNDLNTDIQTRGLNHIGAHPYVRYGSKLYHVMTRFIYRYLRVYYPTDSAVKADFELQNWAHACAQVPHLKDFPHPINTRMELRKILTHIVYLNAVQHHAMNGRVTWHGSSGAPYSLPALWKAMPTTKLAPGETLDLTQYAIPVSKLYIALGLGAVFYRPPPPQFSLPAAYSVAPFSAEPRLADAIQEYQEGLAKVDDLIATTESTNKFPYDMLRPKELPFTSWI